MHVKGGVSTQRVGRGRLRLWRDSAIPLQAWASYGPTAQCQCHPHLGAYWSRDASSGVGRGFTLAQPICLVSTLPRKPYCFPMECLGSRLRIQQSHSLKHSGEPGEPTLKIFWPQIRTVSTVVDTRWPQICSERQAQFLGNQASSAAWFRGIHPTSIP